VVIWVDWVNRLLVNFEDKGGCDFCLCVETFLCGFIFLCGGSFLSMSVLCF
jgi:hypothetical protein